MIGKIGLLACIVAAVVAARSNFDRMDRRLAAVEHQLAARPQLSTRHLAAGFIVTTARMADGSERIVDLTRE